MSVSVYYSATRATPLTAREEAAVERVTAAHLASFPYDDEESLYLYDGGGSGPEEILAGSTKLPLDPDRLLPVIGHVLDAVTALRRAVPGAGWHVHLDDLDVEWDESAGYTLPGLGDASLAGVDLSGL